MDNKYTKPSQEELKEELTPIQYKATQQNPAERPFQNEFNDHEKESYGEYIW